MSINPLQEDKGLAKIHSVCAEMDAIWRPTANHDLGVDGQIEFIEPGTVTSTGIILAVQSKSGPSYFEREEDGHILFQPEEKHRRYWTRLRLPIILVLHNPNRDLTIFANIKPQIKTAGPLKIDKNQLFRPDARERLYAIGSTRADESTAREILDEFKAARHPSKGISGIEFLLAMSDPAQRYFELRMCRYMLLADVLSEDGTVFTGEEDYSFIQRCTLKCHLHGLVEPFLEEFERSWYEMNMVPDILVALTPKGREVLGLLIEEAENYLATASFKEKISAKNLALNIQQLAEAKSELLDRSDRLGEFFF